MADSNKPHLFLLNPSGENRAFDASRGYTPTTINQKPSESYTSQKVILGDAYKTFTSNRFQRRERRSLELPAHLEFIQIDFFVIFNNNDAFKNKTRFKNNFGLIPVVYSNFNQTVLFAITDEDKFNEFARILEQFINSSEQQHPSGTEYAIITIIKDFRFISSERILSDIDGGDVLLSLVEPSEEIREAFVSILNSLKEFLQERKNERSITDYSTDDTTTVQIKTAGQNLIQEIADNFDIVFKIQSIRVPAIRPNIYNQPEITWGFDIMPPKNNDVFVGILDNGVRNIDPLKNVIVDYGLDITSHPPNALMARSPHGTVVATLAALGLDYFDINKKQFISDTWIVPIKILDFSVGYFNPYDIEEVIERAYKQGVRIFNLSVCGPCKNYNSGTSEYAYLLDKLAFKYDILIFIATGNLDSEDILAMRQEEGHNGFHDYPNHFYNPNKLSMSHCCESSNICIPAESWNNITVGAIADNCNKANDSDLTPFKEFPAFYTRKHNIDYLQKVNGTYFSDSQKNLNINKPDIVMPGGDVLNESSGMHVVGFGISGNDFYYNDAGTSLATPLATNIAAKLLGLYPQLKMQSIKALIINGASRLLNDEFLANVVNEVKNEEALKLYGKEWNDLEKNQKRFLNTNLNSRDLYKKLIGYGKPDIQKVLYSSKKEVTLVVQDSIFYDSFKVININIPGYLLDYERPSYILNIKASLCYKFNPVFNNHLGYNPLHISFNFIKSVEKDNPTRVAEIISNSKDEYFNQFYEAGYNDEEKRKARRRALGIKTEIQSWSEDFYPRSNKPFSNTQSLELKISVDEITKADQQISLIVRCTCKTDYDRHFVDWLKSTPHEFSIAITVNEKLNDELADFSLYDELYNSNELDQIIRIDVDAEQEGEAIIEADI